MKSRPRLACGLAALLMKPPRRLVLFLVCAVVGLVLVLCLSAWLFFRLCAGTTPC
jgi:hypothetical protein